MDDVDITLLSADLLDDLQPLDDVADGLLDSLPPIDAVSGDALAESMLDELISTTGDVAGNAACDLGIDDVALAMLAELEAVGTENHDPNSGPPKRRRKHGGYTHGVPGGKRAAERATRGACKDPYQYMSDTLLHPITTDMRLQLCAVMSSDGIMARAVEDPWPW